MANLFFIVYKNSSFGDSSQEYSDRCNKYEYTCFYDEASEVIVRASGNTTQWHKASEFGANGVDGLGSSYNSFRLKTYRLGDTQIKEYRNKTSPKFDLKSARLTTHKVIFWIPFDNNQDYNDQSNRIYEIVSALNGRVIPSRLSTPPQTVYVGGFSQPWSPSSPPRPTKPYTVTLDHGQITVDPSEPYFDSSAGETGQWTDPSAPPSNYPYHG